MSGAREEARISPRLRVALPLVLALLIAFCAIRFSSEAPLRAMRDSESSATGIIPPADAPAATDLPADAEIFAVEPDLAARGTECRLEGRVTDDSGTPIPNARIEIFARSGGVHSAESTSDRFGEYRIEGIPPGDYRLVAVADGLISLGFRDPEIRVSVGEALTARYDVELSRGATYRAQVVSGGIPLSGARVGIRVWDSQGGSEEPAFDQRVVCREDGWFELRNLPEGEVELLAESGWLDPIRIVASAVGELPSTVSFPEPVRLEAELRTRDRSPLPRTITTSIRFDPARSDAAVVPSAFAMELQPSEVATPERTQTHSVRDGRIELGLFSPGSVVVRFTSRDFEEVPPIVVQVGPWADERISVELVPKPSFRCEVTVVDCRGVGVAGASVRLHGDTIWKGLADARGVARIVGRGVPTGFEVTARGFASHRQEETGNQLPERLAVELRDEAVIVIRARTLQAVTQDLLFSSRGIDPESRAVLISARESARFNQLTAGTYEVRVGRDFDDLDEDTKCVTRTVTAIEGRETVVEVLLP